VSWDTGGIPLTEYVHRKVTARHRRDQHGLEHVRLVQHDAIPATAASYRQAYTAHQLSKTYRGILSQVRNPVGVLMTRRWHLFRVGSRSFM
jgi:hypothetical protein